MPSHGLRDTGCNMWDMMIHPLLSPKSYTHVLQETHAPSFRMMSTPDRTTVAMVLFTQPRSIAKAMVGRALLSSSLLGRRRARPMIIRL